MNSQLLKKALPHILAIAVFLIVAVVYCHPALQGKGVGQSDMEQWKGMAQQAFDYKDKHGDFPLWTESAFSGMPTYTIAMPGSKVSFGFLTQALTLGLPQPINFFFVACLCFYILMCVLRIDPWIGVLASLAYAYSSYDPVIIITGHVTKMQALTVAPAVIASLLLLFRRKYLWGTFLLALFFAAELASGHLQMVYYTVICMGLLTLFYAIQSIREGKGKDTAIAIGLAIVACGIGFGTSLNGTMPLKEYTQETMRGGRTELTNDASKQEGKGGLDRDYAFNWSYGIGETSTLAVPNMYGGGGGDRVGFGDDSKTAEVLSQDMNIPEDNAIPIANQYGYWGPQYSTSGPVYIGAVICLLSILALVMLKGWQKWWLLSSIVAGILLAWGRNFPALNNFLFDHLPYYNKFRAPSQSLVLPQLCAPILVALGLQQLLTSGEDSAKLWKKFRLTAYIAGGLLVVLAGLYFSVNFQGEGDSQIKDRFTQIRMQQLSQGKQPDAEIQQQAMAAAGHVVHALQEDRRSMAGSSLFRTFILMVIAAALVGLFIRKKIKPVILLAGLLVLSTYDLLALDSRYLSASSFQDPADIQSSLTPTPADQQISADPDHNNFRVLDESTGLNPFESARASTFHNSVGGYSPAKLGLYQDLIYNQMAKGNMQVYDMLNTKYIIQQDPRSGQPVARINPGAFGPCWLVKAVHYVKDGDEEMKALDSVDVRDTVIIQQKYSSRIPFAPVPDSTASLKLVQNDLDKIDYTFSAKTNQFAVFSEIYYDKGWDAYIDGKKTDYLRVNYALRGMPVPSGQHTIEFRFEPQSFRTGMMLTTLFNIVIYLMLIAGLVVEYRKYAARGSSTPPVSDKKG